MIKFSIIAIFLSFTLFSCEDDTSNNEELKNSKKADEEKTKEVEATDEVIDQDDEVVDEILVKKDKFIKRYKRKALKEIVPKGEIYDSKIILKKVNEITQKMDIDTSEYATEEMAYTWLTGYLQGLENSPNETKDSIFFTYDEDYMFLDINNDNIEDLVFQSRGPFVTDSPMFLFLLSNKKKGKHDAYWFSGTITSISEYDLSIPNSKSEYPGIIINYIQYGCCGMYGWDTYKTDFLFFTFTPHGFENPLSLRSINKNTVDY